MEAGLEEDEEDEGEEEVKRESSAAPVVPPTASSSTCLADDAGAAHVPLSDESSSVADDPKATRKAARKAAKAVKRAVREGRAPPGVGRKDCTLCSRSVDLLVRCQVDESRRWHMVCGRCWQTDDVAGGVVDGSGANPHYRYGGLWKNLKRPPSPPGMRQAVAAGQPADSDDEYAATLLGALGVGVGSDEATDDEQTSREYAAQAAR